MGPKKKEIIPDENAWRRAIEGAPLDEGNWKVKVILIEAAGSEQDRIYLNKFEIFAAEEKRFVIKNICRTETIFMINQLGGEKKVKDDNLRVFEEGQSYLKDKKDIPPDVMALVVKHLILKMKEEYLFIQRQRLEVKQGMQRESATMIDKSEVRGSVSVGRSHDADEQHAHNKGKGTEREPGSVPSDAADPKKYNTLLRVRGEEWRDKVYVDDYPTDGPNLYVAVTGFVEPYLPGCLVKIGIPLTAVVQVRIDPTTTKIPSTLLRPTKRGQSLTELLAEKALRFWDELQLLRIDKDSADDFKNTAFIVFTPPYGNTENLSGDSDKIYDEMCFLMYDIQDLSRQHVHYKDNMYIIHIPEEKSSEHYVKHYQQRLDDLPLECTTIYLLLDSILDTACKSRDLDEKSSRSSLSTAVTLNAPPKPSHDEHRLQKTANIIKNVFNTLCNTEANKLSYRLTYGDEYENHKDPIVIDYGDYAKYTTFQLGNLNLDSIVFTSLLGMPINNLWRNQSRPTGEQEAKINFHVNVLLSCFDREDVETAELYRLMHILACRKLYNNRSSLRKRHLPATSISDFKKNYLKRSVLAEPLPKCPSLVPSSNINSPSFPSITKSENDADIHYDIERREPDPDPEVQRLKFLFDCPDISELVSAAEIENYEAINHMIDDFDYFEDLSGISAFQVMREAFNEFNCVNYKYCEVTDCFILMFFNSHDKDGIAREEWRCHVTTPVCLQDFFDFILDEHYAWIQNEEKMYDENIILKAKSLSKDFIDPFALKSCIENNDVEMDLLMEGSLKYQEIAQVEDATHDGTEVSEVNRKKSAPSSLDMDSKSSKKTKSASSPKTVRRQSFMGHADNTVSVELPAKPFLGYDLGDRRVEVFGKDAIFFSKDGTKVKSMYTLIIPNNLEYIVLNVLPGNSYNEFWIHRALGEYVSTEVLDICESFRITSRDQVMMYMKKQSYQVLAAPVPAESVEKKGVKTSVSEKASSMLRPIYETKFYHSLYVTWPNGIITETVYIENSPILSHIKQYHTRGLPNLNEDMRCISLNGEVVIFNPSGEIEVLKPDGTYIKLFKYYKTIVVPEPVVVEEREEPVEKTKKPKSKAKLSKSSSKSSKYAGLDEDKFSEIKPIEYEIIVDEFEIIETSGLRQKWVYNTPYDIEKLLIRTATDYCLGEVFTRRMDGTNILLNKDGIHVVTFPNKTRIITYYIVEEEEIYPEWTDVEIEYFEMFEPDHVERVKSKESVSQKSYTADYAYNTSSSFEGSISEKVEEEGSAPKGRTDGYISIHLVYTIEHANFSTVTINSLTGKISIDSPNETTVVVDKENNYDIKLDHVTNATFDGENLHISYEACPECRSFTNCHVKIMTAEETLLDSKPDKHWLKMKDSFNQHVVVNEEGSITLLEEQSSTEVLNSGAVNTESGENTGGEATAEGVVNPEATVNTEGAVSADAAVNTETAVNTESADKEVAGNKKEAKEAPDLVEDKAPDGKSETSLSHGRCREIYLAKNIRFFILKR